MGSDATTNGDAPTVVYSGAVAFEDGSAIHRERGGQNVVDPGPNAAPGESTADGMTDVVQIRYLNEE